MTAGAVSRETGAPAPPAAARVLFGDRLGIAAAYAALLAGPGVERGVLGPREVPRLWDRHLLNCAVVADLIDQGAAVDDVGSGAGMPGIVLALLRPDLRVTLVEPLLRRTNFLHDVLDELGLDAVAVDRARASDRARTSGGRADVVTARAVAPLDRLLGWCLPLLRPGGVLLAMKGVTAHRELDAAGPVLERLGGTAEVVEVGVGIVDPPTSVVRVWAGAHARTNPRAARRARS
jgi:16S rRNA (guanine527-N7)-methyltransferase